jgi:hypothetical protein
MLFVLFLMRIHIKMLPAKRTTKAVLPSFTYELSTLLKRHFHPLLTDEIISVVHTAARHSASATSKASKQDARKNQQTCRLPEANGGQPEYGRHQAVPQQHNYRAECGCNQKEPNGH